MVGREVGPRDDDKSIRPSGRRNDEGIEFTRYQFGSSVLLCTFGHILRWHQIEYMTQPNQD